MSVVALLNTPGYMRTIGAVYPNGRIICLTYALWYDIRINMRVADVPADPQARREWIKYQLRLRGLSLAAIARDLGVSRHAPHLALVKPYPRMERAIADKLELEPRQIWPERYDESGKPNRTLGRPHKRIDSSIH